MAARIDTELYWSLPGPRSVIMRIEESAAKSRLIWLNQPNEALPGTWDKVRAGLESGYIDAVIGLTIRGGTDIASDIAVHFEKTSITADELAGFNASARTAVILRSEGEAGAENCEHYAKVFMGALEHISGNVHLVIAGHEESMTCDVRKGEIQVIAFDGGLSQDEMDAYVALRMLNRAGPGSTRLTRSIISEFAGFDVELAEQLMLLDESHLVNIIENLSLLMGNSPFRWRHDSWLMRTRTNCDPSATHVLNDKHLSEHGPVRLREEAKNRIKRRYWRACVKTLTPWLEERRLRVLSVFTSQIQTIAAANDGKIIKPIGNNQLVALDPEELEYNNIVGMVKGGKLSLNNSVETAAHNVCQLAKNARDDIAHMRAPNPVKVSKLIVEMDRLLGA